MEIDKLDRAEHIEKLKKKLNEKRFIHSIGVEYTAACLAMAHGADVNKARIAGLLHDNAKCFTLEEKLKKARKHGIEINECEEKNPDLLHGKLGAYYAKEKFGVDDQEILDAITYHTTGRPDMTTLDKIIYIADFMEPNRKMLKDMTEIRQEAFTDLDKCLVHILKNILEYLETKDFAIDDMTRKTYEFYSKQ